MSQQKNSTGLIAGLAIGLPLVLILMLVIIIADAEEQHAAQTNCTPGGDTQLAAYVDPSSVPKGPIAGYSGEQLVNAATIMLAARELNLSQHAQQVGVMAAMGESSLRNLDHGDAVRNDTIGLFQIGPEHGTRPQRMDPMWSAKNFFSRLTAVDGWETLEPTIAAHRAQRNADPYHYRRHWNTAGQTLSALGNVQAGPSTAPAANTEAMSPGSYNLGQVQPQLRAMVEVLGPMFGIETVGGYRESATDPGGHPAGLAADFMVPMNPSGKAQGDALAEYARANAEQLGIDYIIWYQRIWSVGRAAEGWRPMESRGSATADHLDHVHINSLPDGNVPSSGGGTTSQVLAQNCASAATSSGAWTTPVDNPRITSDYGPRTHPVGGGSSFHDGVDYGASCGTPVKAASGGVVTKAGPDSIYGNQIVIDHGGGIITEYGHMHASGVLARVGDQVATGDIIAKVGSDGRSTGCHLHFTVEVDGEHTDPEEFLANPPTGGIGGGLTVVQANVKQHRGDVATVGRLGADFLSFNEVSRLSNSQLSPNGYRAYRPAGGNSQARSTAVAWRTDQWSRIAGGRTRLVDNGPQKWDAGRSATWATVENADGGRASIISTHLMIDPAKYGPNKPLRQRLYSRAMQRLQALIGRLSSTGPVLVAGDFNSSYGSGVPWGPTKMLGAIGMRPTFATQGATGTHDSGARIDYVFHDPTTLRATGQRTRPLRSDHHALITQFAPAA